jgi:hypothetical protein
MSTAPLAWYHDDHGVLELSRVPRPGWKPLFQGTEAAASTCVPLPPLAALTRIAGAMHDVASIIAGATALAETSIAEAKKAPEAEATEEQAVREELERLKQTNEKLLEALKVCQFLIGPVTEEYERQNPLTRPTLAAYYDGANRRALEAIALAEGGKP